MTYLSKNGTRTKHVVVENYLDCEKWKNKLPRDGKLDFRFLGMIYPHARGNKLRPEAVILTNSDQIEHLQEIVEALPNINFHIAAITEMSAKLLAFDKYNNVHLYPNHIKRMKKRFYISLVIFILILIMVMKFLMLFVARLSKICTLLALRILCII